MIKRVLVAIMVLFGAQVVFSAGSAWEWTSTPKTTTGTVTFADTVASVQIENLAASGNATFSIDGVTDTVRPSSVVNVPFLPFLKKNLQVKIVSLPAGATVQVRIFGGKE